MQGLHNHTITVFNRYESRLGDAWYATTIHGVQLTTDKAAMQAKYGAESQDTAAVSIPYTSENGERMISGKRWLSPKKWDKQTNDLLPKTVTFTPGQTFDFFISGGWDGPQMISDADYTGGFYGYMEKNHDFVFAITSVGGPYDLIPHFEIMGR